MIIGTSYMSKFVDADCVESLGIPFIVLMENAVLAAIKHMDYDIYENYTVICGMGNNGGDGLGIARHLYTMGKKVKIFIVGDIDKLSECFKINYNIVVNMKMDISIINDTKDLHILNAAIKESNVTIDAIFGTGLKREVSGIFKKVINIINNNSTNTYSIDVPSGLDSDSGKILGTCVKAYKTISFEFYKRGFLNYDSKEFIGDIAIEHIGIPDFIIERYSNKEYITSQEFLKKHIKEKNKYDFKSKFGKVSILAGSNGFYGASYIATEAAVKCGSGLVTLISNEETINNVSIRLTEAMTTNYSNKTKVLNLLKSSDAIGFGPGMGATESTFNKLIEVIENSNCPIIIDADGLNVIKGRIEILKSYGKQIIITPHLGEMSKLTNKPIEYIRENRIDVAKEFAKEYRIIVLLKGYETIITNGDTTYINPTGNSSMANGGMGDCLLGMITSFIGQRIEPFDACICAAYVHGYIGDKLSESLYTVNASDIIKNIQSIMHEIKTK